MNLLNLLPISNVVGSLVSAGASLIGGNEQAAAQREANEQNYRMFQEQLGFTKDMYEDAKAYNTPAAQRQRYEQAGINPYMAMSNIGAGNVEAMQSPSANPAQAAVGAGQGIAAAGASLGAGIRELGSSVSLVQQVQAQKEAVRAARIENCFRVDKEIANLLKMQRENDLLLSKQNLTDVERDNALKQQSYIDEQLAMARIQRSYYGRLMKATTEKEEKQVMSIELQNQYQYLVNRAFPSLNEKQQQLLSAQASQALESALLAKENQNLTREEARRVVVQTLGDTIANGIKANEFELSGFNLNDAELESMRKGDIISRKQNSQLFNMVDGAVSWIVDSSIGRLFK